MVTEWQEILGAADDPTVATDGPSWRAAAAAGASTMFKCAHIRNVDWKMSLSPTTDCGAKIVDLRSATLQGKGTCVPAASYSPAAKTYDVILNSLDPKVRAIGPGAAERECNAAIRAGCVVQ